MHLEKPYFIALAMLIVDMFILTFYLKKLNQSVFKIPADLLF